MFKFSYVKLLWIIVTLGYNTMLRSCQKSVEGIAVTVQSLHIYSSLYHARRHIQAVILVWTCAKNVRGEVSLTSFRSGRYHPGRGDGDIPWRDVGGRALTRWCCCVSCPMTSGKIGICGVWLSQNARVRCWCNLIHTNPRNFSEELFSELKIARNSFFDWRKIGARSCGDGKNVFHWFFLITS